MNVLGLAIVPAEHRRSWPTVRISIDGQDPLGAGMDGCGPVELLDSGALLPVDPPRRVGLYGCGCAVPSCSNVTAVITQEGGTITWRAFWDVMGSFDEPLDEDDRSLEEEDADFLGPFPLDLPDLVFDAGAYLETVRAATADRSWESPRWGRARG